jgi:uncharacterized protein YuzE
MGTGVYLEVTFRGGKPWVAYLRLPRQKGDHAAHSREMEPDLVVDFAEDDRPIGVEILSPAEVTPEIINNVLRELGVEPVAQEEFAPLGSR